jgi:hypothetical protein
MNHALEIIKKIMDFAELHEGTVGRVAILSSKIERNIDNLFGYVFNLKNEQWSIITLNVRSIQSKIDVLSKGLRQEVCPVGEPVAAEMIAILKDLGPFFEFRNAVVHGEIRPDYTALMSVLNSADAGALQEGEIDDAVNSVLREYICVPRFNAKSREIDERRFSKLEREQLIGAAEQLNARLFSARESIREKYDWIGINMPRSELRKLEAG